MCGNTKKLFMELYDVKKYFLIIIEKLTFKHFFVGKFITSNKPK
jgi:hypothetical protein